jgi:hypothetical protein
MSETTQPPPAPAAQENANPAPANPAVNLCAQAYERAYKAAKRQKDSELYAEGKAEMAFCKAMPQLSGQENIKDFIACVAYGILIKAIPGPEGARLLYAAQVANSAIRGQRSKLDKLNAPIPPGSLSPLVRQYYKLSD